MTALEKFLNKYKEVWSLHAWQVISGKYISTGSGAIRTGERACLCPLTCVAEHELNKRYHLWFAEKAGEALGLTNVECKRIMDSADNNFTSPLFDGKLRLFLLNPLTNEMGEK